jgi:2-aminoethylphosphonate-pyruvate transaminase
VPFTPSIPAIYGLEAALEELAEEGREARRERYRERMAVLDAELERLGLEVAVAPQHRSSSVRSIALPPGVAYPALHDALRAEGYVIYAGLGPAAAASFRVCLLGNIEPDAVRGFGAVLERTLADIGRPA